MFLFYSIFKTFSASSARFLTSTQVTAKISVNKPGTLLFPLPKTLTAGTYRIVLKTRCTSNLKYKRKELITTISNVIKIQ